MLQQNSENDTPVSNGAQKHEYMPNSVVVGELVVGKEIGANGIENAFAEKEKQREGRELCPDSRKDEQYTPTHNEVHRQGELGALAYRHNLDDGAY